MIKATVIADSLHPMGNRLTTLSLVYPRFIHAQLLTHRAFSRNSSSSRAVPLKTTIAAVTDDPVTPVYWGKNQPGMHAQEELDAQAAQEAKAAWLWAAEQAVAAAGKLSAIGVHKEIANRVLEPFLHIHTLVTATEFENFFALRDHDDAQPEIRALARAMRTALQESTPEIVEPGQWHLPYVTAERRQQVSTMFTSQPTQNYKILRLVSAACCCRVSYLKHDGTQSTIEEDLKLCDRLLDSRPFHASPFEHQAMADYFTHSADGRFIRWRAPQLHGNFEGWCQYRKLLELRSMGAQEGENTYKAA
jgi:thymidylate synthase ThyX